MSHFPYAIEAPLKHEGGYANDPKDPGGETYRGISRVYNPSWPGWPKLDAIAEKKWNQIFPALEDEVKAFYFREFWTKHNLDKVDDRDIAAAALDTVIQHGKGAQLIQQSLQVVGHPVSVDGKLGPASVAAMNRTPAKKFLAALHDVREAYYRGLVAKDPSLAKFLPGWLSRISPWKGVVAAGGLAALAALAAGAWYYLKSRKVV